MSPGRIRGTLCCRDGLMKANGSALSQPWRNWEWKRVGCRSMTAPRFTIARTSKIPRRRFAMSEISSHLLCDRQLRLPPWRRGLRFFLCDRIEHVLINLDRARLFHSRHHRTEIVAEHLVLSVSQRLLHQGIALFCVLSQV